MELNGPIVFIDDDEDDQVLFEPILNELAPASQVLFFQDPEQAITYLRMTQQRPFLIIAEVGMQRMNGIELRQEIERDPVLRKRAIPFIFFTHPIYRQQVEEAYELTIQGFFEKKESMTEARAQLAAIVTYWSSCLHPNRFTDAD
jgi:CheY-like chemotaxis protein